jgi:hypothetical protein
MESDLLSAVENAKPVDAALAEETTEELDKKWDDYATSFEEPDDWMCDDCDERRYNGHCDCYKEYGDEYANFSPVEQSVGDQLARVRESVQDANHDEAIVRLTALTNWICIIHMESSLEANHHHCDTSTLSTQAAGEWQKVVVALPPQRAALLRSPICADLERWKGAFHKGTFRDPGFDVASSLLDTPWDAPGLVAVMSTGSGELSEPESTTVFRLQHLQQQQRYTEMLHLAEHYCVQTVDSYQYYRCCAMVQLGQYEGVVRLIAAADDPVVGLEAKQYEDLLRLVLDDKSSDSTASEHCSTGSELAVVCCAVVLGANALCEHLCSGTAGCSVLLGRLYSVLLQQLPIALNGGDGGGDGALDRLLSAEPRADFEAVCTEIQESVLVKVDSKPTPMRRAALEYMQLTLQLVLRCVTNPKELQALAQQLEEREGGQSIGARADAFLDGCVWHLALKSLELFVADGTGPSHHYHNRQSGTDKVQCCRLMVAASLRLGKHGNDTAFSSAKTVEYAMLYMTYANEAIECAKLCRQLETSGGSALCTSQATKMSSSFAMKGLTLHLEELSSNTHHYSHIKANELVDLLLEICDELAAAGAASAAGTTSQRLFCAVLENDVFAQGLDSQHLKKVCVRAQLQAQGQQGGQQEQQEEEKGEEEQRLRKQILELIGVWLRCSSTAPGPGAHSSVMREELRGSNAEAVTFFTQAALLQGTVESIELLISHLEQSPPKYVMGLFRGGQPRSDPQAHVKAQATSEAERLQLELASYMQKLEDVAARVEGRGKLDQARKLRRLRADEPSRMLHQLQEDKRIALPPPPSEGASWRRYADTNCSRNHQHWSTLCSKCQSRQPELYFGTSVFWIVAHGVGKPARARQQMVQAKGMSKKPCTEALAVLELRAPKSTMNTGSTTTGCSTAKDKESGSKQNGSSACHPVVIA